MVKSLWILGALTLWAATAWATPFEADGTTTGTTVLWFYGTRVTTEFDGRLDVSGTIEGPGGALVFAASGTAFGAGVADTATLAAEIWSLFAVHGQDQHADSITLVGGMSIASSDADLTGTSMGSGSGTFLARLVGAGVDVIIRGTVAGTARGAFVPPAIPTTMQIEGAGIFSFTAFDAVATDPDELTSLAPDDLPWDASAWPSELLAQLFRLLIDGRPAEPSG